MWLLNFLPDIFFHIILLIGLLGIAVSFVLNFIPFVSTYRVAIQAVAILLTVAGVWYEGGIAKDQEYRAKIAELEKKVAVAEAKSHEVNTVIETKIVEKIKVVKENVYINREIIKEVAGGQLNAICTLPKSTISLHDSASRNEVPDSTRGVDEGASKVKLSGIAETVTTNYTTYYEVAEQLKSLQEWIKAQQTIYNK